MIPRPASSCPECGGEVRQGWLVCPSCAAPLNGDVTTKGSMASPTPSSSSDAEGRFIAGTVLAARYRVLGLLGRGGMGEVYRAYDLILNQSVALKFLPHRFNEEQLGRFRNEVRVARQVSHPNVCRVYDIGVVDGMHFLSMEYLDGEDLASLLRRIGRLPQDKALEFTRKLSAGLNAAHERGVLHRDLKPANIMIDGRGQLRITDFGLAGLAEEIALTDIRSGTPAYMSPEQKAGKEVTTRSDIYALGLVMYEMFTGKHRAGASSSVSDIIKDIDPAIERVIQRCLEDDPRRRPGTALSVAMALPGGDPIAAALAAGETPLPEIVAASEEKEGLTARTAVLCFAAIVLSVVINAVWVSPHLATGIAPLRTPPDALAFQARDMLKGFGYTETPLDSAYGFDCCFGGNGRFLSNLDETRQYELLRAYQPPFVRFWYREFQSDRFEAGSYIEFSGTSVIAYDSPENTEAGMIRVSLDPTGRLVELEARPGQEFARETREPLDWDAVFTAAGLDKARFTRTEPSHVPSMAFDERSAWAGTYSDRIPEQIRIEAASWQGRPVSWKMTGDWDTTQPLVISAIVPTVGVIVMIALLGGAVLAARSNLRAGRGDRKGAALVAGVFFFLSMGVWALRAAHVPSFWEGRMLISALSQFGFVAAMMWLAYIAIEPYMRRHWPDALISWNRLQAGRIRDPLVASHVLIGLTLRPLTILFLMILLGTPPRPGFLNGYLDSPKHAIGFLIGAPGVALLISVAFLMLVVVSRMLLPKVWIADVVASILMGITGITPGGSPTLMVAGAVANSFAIYVALWVFRRFGFLATVAWWLGYACTGLGPLILTEWYAGFGIAAHGIPVALAAYALWVIVSSERRPAET